MQARSSAVRTSVLTLLALGALAAPLAAQDRGRGGPPHHGPPAEALAACSAHVSGASCSFVDARGGHTVTGTCGAPSSDLPLACMPAGGPPHGHPHGPPPEALTACDGIDIGDACVVDSPHGTLEGTCRSTPHGEACVPAHLPARPPEDDGASDAP